MKRFLLFIVIPLLLLSCGQNNHEKLDSLVCLAYEELKSENYMFAQKHIRDARQVSIRSHITNRNWEMDYIDAMVNGEMGTSVDDYWKRGMPLLRSAFDANTERKDGVCVTYVELLKDYALGLAQHYSPDDGESLDDGDMTFEDEFIDVISLLTEKDKYRAYIYSACYYEKNFNVAKNYCEKAISIDSTKSDGYGQLGIIYHTVGDKEQAIKCYEKALAQPDADREYIHRLLALCYSKNSNEYKDHLKQAAQLGDIEAQNRLKEMGISW